MTGSVGSCRLGTSATAVHQARAFSLGAELGALVRILLYIWRSVLAGGPRRSRLRGRLVRTHGWCGLDGSGARGAGVKARCAVIVHRGVCVSHADTAHALVVHHNALPFRDDVVKVPSCGVRVDLAFLRV